MAVYIAKRYKHLDIDSDEMYNTYMMNCQTSFLINIFLILLTKQHHRGFTSPLGGVAFFVNLKTNLRETKETSKKTSEF